MRKSYRLSPPLLLLLANPFHYQTLESDAFVCIREKKSEAASPEVIIVDLKHGNNVIRRPIKADSAIMHWTRQVIALRAQTRTLQIFDLEQKQKLKSTTMSEDVVFWKWISETTIGMVTDRSVYHWDVFDPNQAVPVKVFDRNPNLAVRSSHCWRVFVKMLTWADRAIKSSTTEPAPTASGWLWSAFRHNKTGWSERCSCTRETAASARRSRVMRRRSAL